MNPPNWRRVIGFIGGTALLFALFSLAWPAVGDAYTRGFRRAGNALFGSLGSGRSVRFRAVPKGAYDDVNIILRSADHPGQSANFQISSERTGYRTSSLMLALLLATPGVLRRSWSLSLGLFAIHVFIALRVLLLILSRFAAWTPDGHPALDPWIPAVILDVLMLWTWQETTSNYLAPVLLWAGIVLRHDTFTPAQARSHGATAGTPTLVHEGAPQRESPPP